MLNAVKKFWNDEEGATAIEYGLIAGLVAVGLIVALTALGTDLSALFGRVSTKLNALTGLAPTPSPGT